ncbi:MAG TPA: hypothetical protein DCY79_23410 [Planctomycetaceae bacterium]|nr:hypothetical protein [Blastopirellula sp.]HAY82768.1 hypothetical protein [Planctomycetaceae bacterium]
MWTLAQKKMPAAATTSVLLVTGNFRLVRTRSREDQFTLSTKAGDIACRSSRLARAFLGDGWTEGRSSKPHDDAGKAVRSTPHVTRGAAKLLKLADAHRPPEVPTCRSTERMPQL